VNDVWSDPSFVLRRRMRGRVDAIAQVSMESRWVVVDAGVAILGI
jgi:hypothetical protein